jgi:serine/threonine protein kinase
LPYQISSHLAASSQSIRSHSQQAPDCYEASSTETNSLPVTIASTDSQAYTFPMILTQPLAKDHWKHSFDSYDAPIIGRGSSGYVFEIDQDLVFKEFSEDEEGQLDFERETSIYGDLQRGSGSPYITKLIEKWRDGLVLERHSCTLRSRLQEKRPFSIERRTQWVIEACKGLAFLHQNGIMHGDVGCHNFLVDKEGYIKLCDFAGSKRKGEIARVCYEVRGQHPDYRVGQPTSTTEVFSLVSF